MKWMTDIEITPPPIRLNYNQSVFLIGSCFTEHIGNRLLDYKYPVLQNPNGILFDPVSVCNSLQSYIAPQQYTADDLFFLDDLWRSWRHHSVFSGVDQQQVLDNINQSQQGAHDFLRQANWMIITLGSSYSYQLADSDLPVANCHRAPAKTFNKVMVEAAETQRLLQQTITALRVFNPTLQIVFTISPVRHLRDGVINNNRSKARLIEAVHTIVEANEHCHYFPAYELVIDVLRDYRFYDIDLAHPNYAATEYVFEQFAEAYIDAETRLLMEEVKKITTAAKHKPFQPTTNAHLRFMEASLTKAKTLQQKLPKLDFGKEIAYFSSTS